MKYLITGGAGFIGINFIEYMLKSHEDDDFVIIDKLTYAANVERLKELISQHKNITFYKEDIVKYNSIKKIFNEEKPEIVINFAAETHVDRSISNPNAFVKTNVFGTYVLLDLSKINNVKKYVQISTDEVYGSLSKETFEIKKEFNVDDPLNPTNPYSATKASADLLTLSYFKTYKLPINIIRMTNNFGPYQNEEKMIPHTILSAISLKGVALYNDGSNLRDWLYVKDSVKTIDLIINKGQIGKIYHISTHNLLSNYNLVKLILEKLNINYDVIRYVQDRPAHDYAYSLNTKETEELEHIESSNFSDALDETIEFYKKKSKHI